MRVFVSHSSRNLDVALAVEDALRSAGHDPWLDATDIRAGALLRTELHQAIADCESVVVLWSAPASQSRWCAAEVLAAHHLARGIVVGDVDGTARPPLFSEHPTVVMSVDGPSGVASCVAGVSAGTYHPPPARRLTPELEELHGRIGAAQLAVLTSAAADLAGARRQQADLTGIIAGLAEQFGGEPVFWTILGYQFKNTYQLAWWEQQGALRPPADALLLEAEQWFFRALFADPDDLEALNGLGSVLITEREAEAATFIIDRVLAIAEAQGLSYPAALHDKSLAERLRRDRIGLQRSLQPRETDDRRVHQGVVLAATADRESAALAAALEHLEQAHIDLLGAGPGDVPLERLPDACSTSRAALAVWSDSVRDDADQLTRVVVALHEGSRIVPLRLDDTPLADLFASTLAVDVGADGTHEIDKLVRTLRRPPRERQVLTTTTDWEPAELRRVGALVSKVTVAGRASIDDSPATRATCRKILRRAATAALRWSGFPGAHRYLALAHVAVGQSMTATPRGRAARSRHLELARLATLHALLLDPTDAPSLALLADLSRALKLPLEDYFSEKARHHAEQRGEEVGRLRDL